MKILWIKNKTDYVENGFIKKNWTISLAQSRIVISMETAKAFFRL